MLFGSRVVIVENTVNNVQTWEASTFWPCFRITLGEREEALQVIALTPPSLTKSVIMTLYVFPSILQGLAVAKTSRDISLPITSHACPVPGRCYPNVDTTPSAYQESCLDNFS